MYEFVKGALMGVVFLITSSAALSFYAWLVMLASGAIGHVFEADNLFIEFWTDSFIVAIALSVLGVFFRSSR